ncbi:PRC-barrel domain-containing protein (plasmid) [Roseivivax marinus]|uniref:PRC-barrel domain-containing protein n=1 Tax=Roseivivax marinus TaxID=1379903 RepID=UPI001F03CB57|nr:PRC-barrel domain-containing protein [Roseivivax marinus]UMA66994.1 PRC-barrel domain-containing protein [Roseivivax marinus]
MLVSYNDITHFGLKALDGRKGRARDFYFDDASWHIRYLVAESGFLFTYRESLIETSALGPPEVNTRTLPINLTQQQIEEADQPEADPPVSEQRERAAKRLRVETWPPIVTGVPGAVYTPSMAEGQLLGAPAEESRESLAEQEITDPHLRSMAEVSGYVLEATDGEIGNIFDFIVDPTTWDVRYLVADTGNWLPGRQVAIRPEWIKVIRWEDRRISVDVTKDGVENARELSELDDLEHSIPNLAIAPYGGYAGLPM